MAVLPDAISSSIADGRFELRTTASHHSAVPNDWWTRAGLRMGKRAAEMVEETFMEVRVLT